jgi:hypothetical protein
MTRMPDPTVPRCDCGWLEDAAGDPSIPVVFDELTGEFQIVRSGEMQGRSPIYHCPFCGGSAPESKRGELFERITPEEMYRLHQLTEGVRNVSEAIAKFGEPEEDLPNGHAETPRPRDGEPPRTQWFRTLRYSNLSSTAIVDVVVHVNDRVQFGFMPKSKRS